MDQSNPQRSSSTRSETWTQLVYTRTGVSPQPIGHDELYALKFPNTLFIALPLTLALHQTRLSF